MGFYTTEVLAGDARRHGIELARPDVNLSGTGWVVETDRRIRLGLAVVTGVGSEMAATIAAEREANGPFRSLFDLVERTGLRPEAAENLILAGALDGSRNEQRRELLWQLGLLHTRGRAVARPGSDDVPRAQPASVGGSRRGTGSRRAPTSDSAFRIPHSAFRQPSLPLPIEQDAVALPPMSAWEEVAAEYAIMGLAPAQQAMALLRSKLNGSILTSAQATDLPDGTEVRVAGLAVCRQRPSTAKGVLFVSLEDEYGIANLVVYPPLFERQRTLILGEPFLIARGRVQRQGTVVHIVAQHFERIHAPSERLIAVSHDFH
jgi:error-prone DNA polymerase